MTSNFLYRFFSSIILAPTLIYIIIHHQNYFYYILILITALCLFEIIKIRLHKYQLTLLILLMSFIYSCMEIFNRTDGSFILIYILTLTWLSDIGGYLFGHLFKGKKINIISPNKTYVGFLGSILLSQFTIVIFIFVNFELINNKLFEILFVMICAIITIIGDLFFSFVKRKSGIKDFSNFIPGHGGIFDRIDGMIFLTIFIFIFLKFI